MEFAGIFSLFALALVFISAFVAAITKKSRLRNKTMRQLGITQHEARRAMDQTSRQFVQNVYDEFENRRRNRS